MNPADHQNVPAGTLHCQDRNGPVTVLRDYDTLLLDSWRLSVAEARRLRQVISDALPDMIAAQAEMAGEAAEVAGAPVSGCSHCGERITFLGGSWTTDDGTIACYANPNTSASYVPHKPKEG